jgi:hypothetical protein
MAPGWELDFKTFFHRVMIPDPALSHEDVIFEEGGLAWTACSLLPLSVRQPAVNGGGLVDFGSQQAALPKAAAGCTQSKAGTRRCVDAV